MSSEAAQKAYPASVSIHDRSGVERRAFDRGAVEALRQAAASVQAYSPEWERLTLMADEWVGQ